MKRKFLLLTLCLLAVLTALVGCDNAEQAENTANGYTFTDALNNEITVNNPQNVVACMGGLADIWLLAGGEDSLVGIAEDADFEFDESIATVGKHNEPSVESILALNPDFVILSSATAEQVALADTLKQSGITCAYFDVNSFEDYLNTLKIFTDITDNTAAYEKHGTAVQEQIESVISQVPQDAEAPSVLLLITYSQGVRAQKADTMAGEMLADLGCINIADENPSLLQTFSVESIVDIDPDYIMVIPMGHSKGAATESLGTYLESNPAWGSLSAVQNNHYNVLDPSLFLYKPNAKWGESYQTLFDLIYSK